MAENGAEKTESPTARRREEARQQGQIARSVDLTAAVMLLASMLILKNFGMSMFAQMRDAVESMLSPGSSINPTRADDVGLWLVSAGRVTVLAVAPVALGVMAATLAISFFQVGFIVTGSALEPSLAKLNPLKGLKNIFDIRSSVRLVMSMAKLAVIAAISAMFVLSDLPRILHLCNLEPLPMLGATAEMVYTLALKLAILLVVLAAADFLYQRWQNERDLRMSKEEVKEELKRMDGDPVLKQRRTRIARQMAMQRLGRDVPRADVVVTNPTHFAVALQYDVDSMKAPKVIAKGADFLALRIRQLAAEHGIPMVERKELARGLYRNVNVGDEVPPQFYNAVAEILAYVYRLSGRKSA